MHAQQSPLAAFQDNYQTTKNEGDDAHYTSNCINILAKPFFFDQNNGQDSGPPEFPFYLRIKQHFSNFRLCEMAGVQPKSEQGTEIAAAKKQNVHILHPGDDAKDDDDGGVGDGDGDFLTICSTLMSSRLSIR
ncbi:GM22020 [Drosophila sechellia]|uniref:GM22020 n=1 Tax=Drosophila sechellia TaxID=7238 RepID=B4HQ77_DROSE|nr:GM22020 [Drosophila sechellia]